MCFRSEQFVYIYHLFVYKKNKIVENTPIFQSCFLGLVVEDKSDMPKVLGSNPTQGKQKILLLMKFFRFLQVFKNQNLPKKLFLPETNFDFINVWSNMPPFRVMTISFGKFWSWTPCSCATNVHIIFYMMMFFIKWFFSLLKYLFEILR